MLTLAVDPGSTTGWAVHASSPSDHANGVIKMHGQTPWLDFVEFVEDNVLPFDRILMERFIIHSKTHTLGREGIQDATDCIGAITYLCHRRSVQLLLQSPQTRRPASDDVLRALGWYTTGRHSRDAIRHLVMLLKKEGTLTWPKPS